MTVLAHDNVVSFSDRSENSRGRGTARLWNITSIPSEPESVTPHHVAQISAASQQSLWPLSVGARSSVSFIAKPRAGAKDMGETTGRLEMLAKSAHTWAPQVGVEPPARAAVEFVRAILAIVPSHIADRDIRVFPSEGGGILLQTMKPELRILEVDPGHVLATVLVDEDEGKTVAYSLDSKEAAAAFISGT